MTRFLALTLYVVACVVAGCAPRAKPLAADLARQLEDQPKAVLSGEIIGLHAPIVLDDRDYTYSVALSADGQRAAWVYLGLKEFELGLWRLLPTAGPVASKLLNPHEHDVEAVGFSPDNTLLATAGRDGVVRLFDAATGAPKAAYPTDEPLVSLAFHPTEPLVVVGSAKGLVTGLLLPDLRFAFEQRLHGAEVRALSFSPEGFLWSGGWDKALIRSELVPREETATDTVLPMELKAGKPSIRAHVDGKVAALFAVDASATKVIIGTALAKALGIDATKLPDTESLVSPLGNVIARVAKGHTLAFKDLDWTGVDLAICDSCLPRETQGVLGAPFAEAFQVSLDEAQARATLHPRPGALAPTANKRVLAARVRFGFDWHINDFSIDRTGRRLAIAFSETPAQRTRQVYEREKKGVVEPTARGNCVALVDGDTGALLQSWTTHHGVVSTAAVSPDGRFVFSGGWDRKVYGFAQGNPEPIVKQSFGQPVRRVRVARDGRWLAVGAWTPINAVGDQRTDPSAVVYELSYEAPKVISAP